MLLQLHTMYYEVHVFPDMTALSDSTWKSDPSCRLAGIEELVETIAKSPSSACVAPFRGILEFSVEEGEVSLSAPNVRKMVGRNEKEMLKEKKTYSTSPSQVERWLGAELQDVLEKVEKQVVTLIISCI